ncbi:probable pectate lyase 3 [Arachis duranensis]|uniref:Pectate lyase n=3 Tax=Arachis TaxID=3817 RepID=A0A444WVK4_ARAHY|nr:probable pectate lyase 3 [Arachis duranensis]RYQ81487.1 hypothetical protein Ahy_Scaffold1g107401 [Arachis hypogaea]
MVEMYNLFLSLCLVAMIPILKANILENTTYLNDFDEEYWKERAAIAEKDNREAYFLNPYEISGNFSSTVLEDIVGNKHARRSLKGKNARVPCMATNNIDRCWRCDPNWAKYRQKLANCVQGFGKNTIGGKNGPIYIVTDSSDNDMVNPKPGTLRHAVTRTGPLWIIFARSMFIRLNQELIMTSDKTIDGRGVDVHITRGAGITIQNIKNVIIHGIKIYNIVPGTGGLIRDSETHFGQRLSTEGDGISIFGSSNIWIDHVSMRKCADGLIDAIMGSTAITISNSHFTDQNHVILFGGREEHTIDKMMQVTVAFNHFGKRLLQRMPRCRFGFFHIANNDYTHWQMYAIGGNKNPTIISEGNRFWAPDNIHAKEVTKRVDANIGEWKSWQWRSINDELLNGAFFVQSGSELVNWSNKNKIASKPGKYVAQLTRFAGTLRCRVGKPC